MPQTHRKNNPSPIPINSTIYIKHGLNQSHHPRKATVLAFKPPNDLLVSFYQPVPTKKGLVMQDTVKLWNIISKKETLRDSSTGRSAFSGTMGQMNGGGFSTSSSSAPPVMPRSSISSSTTTFNSASESLQIHGGNRRAPISIHQQKMGRVNTSLHMGLRKNRKLPSAEATTPTNTGGGIKVHFAQEDPSSTNNRLLQVSTQKETANPSSSLSPAMRRPSMRSPLSPSLDPPPFCVGISLNLHSVKATLIKPNGMTQVIDLSDMNMSTTVEDFFHESHDTDFVCFNPYVEKSLKQRANPQLNEHKIAMLLNGNTDEYWYKQLTKRSSGIDAVTTSSSTQQASDRTEQMQRLSRVLPQEEILHMKQKNKKFKGILSGSTKRNYSRNALIRHAEQQKRQNPSRMFSLSSLSQISGSNRKSNQYNSMDSAQQSNKNSSHIITFQDYIIAIRRYVEYCIGKQVRRMVVSVPHHVSDYEKASFPPQEKFLTDRKQLKKEKLSVSIIHHACAAGMAYRIKEKCIILQFDCSLDSFRMTFVHCNHERYAPLHSARIWIGGNDFIDRLFSLVLTQLKESHGYMPIFDGDAQTRIRSHCERAVTSLLRYESTEILIYELSPDIKEFRMSITRKELYDQCEDIFHNLRESMKQSELEMSKKFNLHWSNIDCALLLGDSIVFFRSILEEIFTSRGKTVYFDPSIDQLSRGAALFGNMFTHNELLSVIETTNNAKKSLSRAAQKANTIKNLFVSKIKIPTVSTQRYARDAYSPTSLDELV